MIREAEVWGKVSEGVVADCALEYGHALKIPLWNEILACINSAIIIIFSKEPVTVLNLCRLTTFALIVSRMSSDEIVWQVINQQFCSFKLKYVLPPALSANN
jgi:hypothetical protein